MPLLKTNIFALLLQKETLSTGQSDEIERVCRSYPHLTDDAFVRDNLARRLCS